MNRTNFRSILSLIKIPLISELAIVYSILMLFPLITHADEENGQLADPKSTEQWYPQPPIVTFNPIPSDAIVLLGSDGLDQWNSADGGAVNWDYNNSVMTVKPGAKDIVSKLSFCDMQLHVEWRTPKRGVEAWQVGQNAGNSGIHIQGKYEIQILDSYNSKTYANGQAGALYKQAAPLVNTSRAPLTWQSYDIIYRSPKFNKNGQVTSKGAITVLHNGVVIQNNTEIRGATVYRGEPNYDDVHGCEPIRLQDHGAKVSYRNIWVRHL